MVHRCLTSTQLTYFLSGNQMVTWIMDKNSGNQMVIRFLWTLFYPTFCPLFIIQVTIQLTNLSATGVLLACGYWTCPITECLLYLTIQSSFLMLETCPLANWSSFWAMSVVYFDFDQLLGAAPIQKLVVINFLLFLDILLLTDCFFIFFHLER